jgi:hypothetical protein
METIGIVMAKDSMESLKFLASVLNMASFLFLILSVPAFLRWVVTRDACALAGAVVILIISAAAEVASAAMLGMWSGLPACVVVLAVLTATFIRVAAKARAQDAAAETEKKQQLQSGCSEFEQRS